MPSNVDEASCLVFAATNTRLEASSTIGRGSRKRENDTARADAPSRAWPH